MKTYKKKPLTFNQQLELWKSRGLQVNDDARALRYLAQISYYRLSAYALPFQNVKDTFNEGTTFDDILNLYLFDRKLRLMVFDAIERIEITLRTQMTYILCHKYNDSHWQDNASLFASPTTNLRTGKVTDVFSDTQNIISKHKQAKNPEVFVKHYIYKYNSPANPPSWMCVELLTIGEISRLYNALKDKADKKAIADFFNLHRTVFSSWLHTLVYARNICAHHSRQWNREFAIRPEVLRNPQKKMDKFGIQWQQPPYILLFKHYQVYAYSLQSGQSLQIKIHLFIGKIPRNAYSVYGHPYSQ